MPGEIDRTSARDFYVEAVLPALQQRLDQAFPEFGWRQDAHGWIATNEQTTRERLGVRASRVVAHGAAPAGFLVHGAEPILWTAYLNGGTPPRGHDFVRIVKELADRAGVDASPIELRPRDRQASLLEGFFGLCQQRLLSEYGAEARKYLTGRGLPDASLPDSQLGLVPPSQEAAAALSRLGYGHREIAAAGVLADSRWPGRLCGAWRDEHGRTRTLWVRTLDTDTPAGARYLYLRGAPRSDLPPYGLSTVLKEPAAERTSLVLVEGVLDHHQLRAHGIRNAAALGGSTIQPATFARLADRGFTEIVLHLDNDDAGHAATARAIDNATRATRAPTLTVVEPSHLADSKDPDAYVRERGPDAWRSLLKKRECAVNWRSAALLRDITPEAPVDRRRDALARVGTWLGTLPPRLAVEQEDAIQSAARQCGYSPAAVERAFRARYWQDISRDREMSRER